MIGLQFSGAFNATTNVTYRINYFIDPPPTIIVGESIDIDPATLQTVVRKIDVITCVGSDIIGTLTVNTANPTASLMFGPTNMVGLRNTLTLLPGDSARVFSNRTLLNPAAVASPEPAALVFTGSGLMALFAFGSRSKLRKVFFQFRS